MPEEAVESQQRHPGAAPSRGPSNENRQRNQRYPLKAETIEPASIPIRSSTAKSGLPMRTSIRVPDGAP